MAETILATASQKQIWSTRYFEEYVRNSRFLPYMGASNDAIIITKNELEREAGKTINIPLITRLKSAGVYNDGVLEGKEEQLGNYNMPISVQWVRNAVKVSAAQQYMTEINLLNAGRTMLRTWSAENFRDWIIKMLSAAWDTGVNYPMVAIYDVDGNVVRAAATETNKDAWLGNNLDRILFGALRSNTSGTDHSASLLNIDNSADKLTPAVGRLAKEMAMLADPHIRPFRTDDGEGREYFVMFCGSRSFRDISGSTEMQNANRDARAREAMGMDRNPLFQAGDLILDGIIYREVPEITSILSLSPAFVGAGAGGITVEPNFLCGAQALGVAWGQMPTPKTDRLSDYEFRPGVAIQELRGVEKLVFNNVQQGCVTVYTAGVASA